ncbi:MAG: hypothetical protein RLZZ387_794 [Chloroflexota bacterium]
MLSPIDPDQPAYGYRPADLAAPPAVSIVTPYYNTGPVFMDTIRSVLRQSLQQWEWLIVNDGSDDPDALRTLLPLRSADLRIRVLDQPNRGLPAARNAGVAASRAPLLFFLDSDDMLAPTALEQLAWTLDSRPDSAFAGGWTVAFGAERYLWLRGFDTRHAFPHDNTPAYASMVRRSALAQVGGYDESMRRGLEDYELWVRSAAAGIWGHDVREPLVWIRRKPAQDYTSYRWAFHDDVHAIASFRASLRRRYPRLFRDGPPAVGGGESLLTTHAVIPTALPFDNKLLPGGGRRVLVLVQTMSVGGADRWALDLAAGLTASGDRVSVCITLPGPHDWIDELRRITPDAFELASFLSPADYPRFLHYLIRSRQITHVLISYSLLSYQLLPYLRARCPDVAFVDYLHAEQEHRHGGFPRVALEHDGLLDLHVTTSQHLRSWMLERGGTAERIEVCTVGVDAERWSPDAQLRAATRAGLGVTLETPLVLFVGRLSAEKRPLVVVEALRRLRAEGLAFAAVIAGDGNDMREVRYEVRRGGLADAVRLEGAVPHARVRALMAAADLLILPSAREGIAVTLFEALAMEVVPVAADVGGQRELVTPDVGVLAPAGSEAEAYAAALRALIVDPERRRRMGAAGRRRVLVHFSAEAVLERMRQMLDQAAALNRGAPRPLVPLAAALPAASLAIEHFQLEQRLRRLPPVRLLLHLRHSALARLIVPLTRLLKARGYLERGLYVWWRELMWRLKRALGRPYNP